MVLNNVRLVVSDFSACFRFYRDVMGFELVGGSEAWEYVEFKVGPESLLAIFPRKELQQALGTAALPNADGKVEKAALVFSVDDLDTSLTTLKRRGAQFVTEPTDRPEWGIRTAHLRDPEGTLIELFVPLPKQPVTVVA